MSDIFTGSPTVFTLSLTHTVSDNEASWNAVGFRLDDSEILHS